MLLIRCRSVTNHSEIGKISQRKLKIKFSINKYNLKRIYFP